MKAVFVGAGFVKDYPAEKLASRCEDRQDLRRDVVHATGDDREADPGKDVKLRRAAPTTPSSPVLISSRLEGSGVADTGVSEIVSVPSAPPRVSPAVKAPI
jgi:hypothetical protein